MATKNLPMLRTFRIIIAIVSILAVTLLFVDFTGTARSLWPWLAQIQLIPAVLSLNLLALILILGMTLLFGRVYCSVVCPLGILQDVVNWLRSHIGSKKGRRNRFGFAPAKTKTRLVVFTVFIVLMVIGLTNVLAASIAGLIAPYSAYGRIASQIFAPVYGLINNQLAAFAEGADNYMFYRVTVAVSIPVLVVAIVTLVTIVAFAWRGGRDYCNTICPVGTVLGYLSKYSLLKPVIDTTKCINCTKCARNCKARCIDAKAHSIDYTRCVACMDCIDVCSEGAISYTVRRCEHKSASTAQPDRGRRAFLLGVSVAAGSVAMQSLAKVNDGGLAPLKDKKPVPGTKVVPAGAISLKHLTGKCTACQLCIQSCPNHVLRPSTKLETLMQPEMTFTDGYCDTSCTVCSDVCPVDAITDIDEALKSSIKVGTAVVDISTCLAASQGEKCGNCARHCPTGAITMGPVGEDKPEGPFRPIVNENLCIGCGRCEYYCPVGTVESIDADTAAIHVVGLDVHRII